MKMRRLTIFILVVCLLFTAQFVMTTTVANNFTSENITAITAPAMNLGRQLSAINRIEGNNLYYSQENPAINGKDTCQVMNYVETYQVSKNEPLFTYYRIDLSVLTGNAIGNEVPYNLKHPSKAVSKNNIA